MEKISLVVADRRPIIRLAFRGLLNEANEANNIELVGEAGDGETAQRLCKQHQPTVLLLDASLPGPEPIETVTFVQNNCSETKILIFTDDFGGCEPSCLVEMGIAGCLLKTEATQNLLEAIRRVAGGQTWFSQSMMKALFSPKKSTSSQTEPISVTEDELKILDLMSSEKTGQEIAKVLHVSQRMLVKYRRTLYDKLEVNTQVGAVAEALRRGLIE